MTDGRRAPQAPRPGEVLRYSYLWTHEADTGNEEGRKDRPCAIVLALVRAGEDTELLVAPITSRRPENAGDGVALSAATRRRLGLQDEPCWVVLTEVNRFRWPGPDLRPIDTPAGRSWSYGLLPSELMERIRNEIVARARARTLRTVPRTS